MAVNCVRVVTSGGLPKCLAVSWRFCPLKVLPVCGATAPTHTHPSSQLLTSSPRYNLNPLTSFTKAALAVAQPFTSSPASKPASQPHQSSRHCPHTGGARLLSPQIYNADGCRSSRKPVEAELCNKRNPKVATHLSPSWRDTVQLTH